MKKNIQYSGDARELLLSGVSKIAKAVKITLGPSGKNVLIRNSNSREPFATKDGVTVASEIYSENPVEQIAIEAIQQVANNTDSGSGDGTTTATILAEAIFALGTELVTEETNIIDLKRGIDLAVSLVVKELKEMAVEYKTEERLMQVAMISSNNDEEISKVVVDAFKVAGNQGVVNIKRSKGHDTYLTTIDGMNLDTGYRSRYYVNNHEHDIVEFDKPYVLMLDKKINDISDNLNQLLSYVSAHQIPLLIVCPDIDSSVSDMFIENKVKNVLKICVCKTPGFGDEQLNELHDMATMLGKVPFIENGGLNFDSIKLKVDPKTGVALNIEELLAHIPRSEEVIVTKNRLSIKGPFGITDEEYDKVSKAKEARANSLREELEKEITQYEKSKLQTRISRLTDGIAYINIGAVSEIEYIEKQHRIQDALYGIKSASEEGIIPGGGTALMYISNKLKDVKLDSSESVQLGMTVILNAIQVPFYQILSNVGHVLSNDEINYIVNNFNTGIDARTRKASKNLIESGIIDPKKVTRTALENAASVAGTLLTTDCTIVDLTVYEKPKTPEGY